MVLKTKPATAERKYTKNTKNNPNTNNVAHKHKQKFICKN